MSTGVEFALPESVDRPGRNLRRRAAPIGGCSRIGFRRSGRTSGRPRISSLPVDGKPRPPTVLVKDDATEVHRLSC